MKPILITLFLISSAFAVNNCGGSGKSCPPDAPCCANGYCDKNPVNCGYNCEPLNSYNPKSCFARSHCFSYVDNFNLNQTRVIPSHSWTGDATQAEWLSAYFPSNAKIVDDQLVLYLSRKNGTNKFGKAEAQGVTVATTRWVQYGTITARVKMAKGKGVVSSIVLRGSDGADGTIEDEIDWEWVGSNVNQVQSNYYYWQILSYDNSGFHDSPYDLSQTFHDYTLEWFPEYLRWSMDGKVLRTLYKNQTWDAKLQQFKYPTRESRLAFSLWDGGSQADGTSKWAGGEIEWKSDSKFEMVIDSVQVDCYYKGNQSQVFVNPPYALPTTPPASNLGTGNPFYNRTAPTLNSTVIIVNMSAGSMLFVPILVFLVLLL